MSLRSEYAPVHAELDAFLFSDVGPDARGLQLTVLSLLARLGFDPRMEALRLRQLPDEAAESALTASIEALPEGGWSAFDAHATAVRLLAKLPKRGSDSADGAQSPRLATPRWVIWALVGGFLLVALLRMQGGEPDSATSFGDASSRTSSLAAIAPTQPGAWVAGTPTPYAAKTDAAAV